jgi:hypothetical protein
MNFVVLHPNINTFFIRLFDMWLGAPTFFIEMIQNSELDFSLA